MSRLGQFELEALLGSGGVAEVWRARDTVSGAAVAIKRLLPQLASDRQVRRRFLREAEVVRRLDHPNIVRLIATGDDDQRPVLVMELVDGEDLGRRLERHGRHSPQESYEIAIAVARALAHAHARGIVHRDVKPQNVLLAGSTVKLADFGLARVETLASLTGSSLLWGSPEYMAPELFAHGRVDPRADVFSLGVIIHELVTGRLPWKDGRSPMRIAGGVDEAPLPALGQGEGIDRLVAAMLSPSPDDRPASAAEVVAALEGRAPVPPLVRTAPCAACGVARAEDVPRCFACGHEDVAIRHTTAGYWEVSLDKVKEDAATMGTLHLALRDLTGVRDLKLKFLLGRAELYSKQEQQEALRLPITLFADLDEPAAQAIAVRLANNGLQVKVERQRAIGAQTLKYAIPGVAIGALMSGWMLLYPLITGRHVHATGVVMFAAFGGIFAVGGMLVGWVKRQRRRPKFRLRDDRALAPMADHLLGAAQGISAELAAPEVRALFAEASRELYRLTRRAEQLAGFRPSGSSEAALAQRILSAAPATGARLGAMARRLAALDAALAGDDQSDAVRAMTGLERRLAVAQAAERAALEAARADLEAALDRRSVAEAERERLAADLCRLLATVRNLYRRAATITTADEREQAEIEAAMRELAAPPEAA